MALIPDRICGECTACCTWLAIRAPTLKKLPGVTCMHCTASGGCGIYAARPSPCQDFFCAWRSLPQLGEEWRPDRSEILVEYDSDGVPPPYAAPAIKFTFLGNIARLEWPPFVNLVASLVANRTPVFIAVPIHKEYAAVKVFVTDGLGDAVRARDLQGVILQLSRAALTGMATPGEEYDLAEDS